jgi:hypothetical protein
LAACGGGSGDGGTVGLHRVASGKPSKTLPESYDEALLD